MDLSPFRSQLACFGSEVGAGVTLWSQTIDSSVLVARGNVTNSDGRGR